MAGALWGFVDYENIGSLEGIQLPQLSRLFVFLGAKQQRLSLPAAWSGLAPALTLVKVKTSTKDNVDFHLSYYLGQQNATAAADVRFVVFSRDAGFDPLIAFIQGHGRNCKRVASPLNNVSKSKPATSTVVTSQVKKVAGLSQAASLIHGKLAISKANPPKTEDALKNWIKAHLGGANAEADEVGRVFAELEKLPMFVNDQGKLTYLG